MLKAGNPTVPEILLQSEFINIYLNEVTRAQWDEMLRHVDDDAKIPYPEGVTQTMRVCLAKVLTDAVASQYPKLRIQSNRKAHITAEAFCEIFPSILKVEDHFEKHITCVSEGLRKNPWLIDHHNDPHFFNIQQKIPKQYGQNADDQTNFTIPELYLCLSSMAQVQQMENIRKATLVALTLTVAKQGNCTESFLKFCIQNIANEIDVNNLEVEKSDIDALWDNYARFMDYAHIKNEVKDTSWCDIADLNIPIEDDIKNFQLTGQSGGNVKKIKYREKRQYNITAKTASSAFDSTVDGSVGQDSYEENISSVAGDENDSHIMAVGGENSSIHPDIDVMVDPKCSNQSVTIRVDDNPLQTCADKITKEFGGHAGVASTELISEIAFANPHPSIEFKNKDEGHSQDNHFHDVTSHEDASDCVENEDTATVEIADKDHILYEQLEKQTDTEKGIIKATDQVKEKIIAKSEVKNEVDSASYEEAIVGDHMKEPSQVTGQVCDDMAQLPNEDVMLLGDQCEIIRQEDVENIQLPDQYEGPNSNIELTVPNNNPELSGQGDNPNITVICQTANPSLEVADQSEDRKAVLTEHSDFDMLSPSNSRNDIGTCEGATDAVGTTDQCEDDNSKEDQNDNPSQNDNSKVETTDNNEVPDGEMASGSASGCVKTITVANLSGELTSQGNNLTVALTQLDDCDLEGLCLNVNINIGVQGDEQCLNVISELSEEGNSNVIQSDVLQVKMSNTLDTGESEVTIHSEHHSEVDNEESKEVSNVFKIQQVDEGNEMTIQNEQHCKINNLEPNEQGNSVRIETKVQGSDVSNMEPNKESNVLQIEKENQGNELSINSEQISQISKVEQKEDSLLSTISKHSSNISNVKSSRQSSNISTVESSRQTSSLSVEQQQQDSGVSNNSQQRSDVSMMEKNKQTNDMVAQKGQGSNTKDDLQPDFQVILKGAQCNNPVLDRSNNNNVEVADQSENCNSEVIVQNGIQNLEVVDQSDNPNVDGTDQINDHNVEVKDSNNSNLEMTDHNDISNDSMTNQTSHSKFQMSNQIEKVNHDNPNVEVTDESNNSNIKSADQNAKHQNDLKAEITVPIENINIDTCMVKNDMEIMMTEQGIESTDDNLGQNDWKAEVKVLSEITNPDLTEEYENVNSPMCLMKQNDNSKQESNSKQCSTQLPHSPQVGEATPANWVDFFQALQVMVKQLPSKTLLNIVKEAKHFGMNAAVLVFKAHKLLTDFDWEAAFMAFKNEEEHIVAAWRELEVDPYTAFGRIPKHPKGKYIHLAYLAKELLTCRGEYRLKYFKGIDHAHTLKAPKKLMIDRWVSTYASQHYLPQQKPRRITKTRTFKKTDP